MQQADNAWDAQSEDLHSSVIIVMTQWISSGMEDKGHLLIFLAKQPAEPGVRLHRNYPHIQSEKLLRQAPSTCFPLRGQERPLSGVSQDS